MERDELNLRLRIREVLETYTFEEILDEANEEMEDILIFLFNEYGLLLPEREPL